MWLVILLGALLLDVVIREPPGVRLNPIVWIGTLINKTWRKFKHNNPVFERINGVLFAVILISACTAFVYLLLKSLEFNSLIHLFASALILKYCIAVSAFFDTVKPIKGSLKANDLPEAREHVKHLVTRDTSRLDEKGIISATVESIGENICDALISPLFYFALFGVPGAVACRIINLLDGAVGYKTPERRYFGWFSARLDDAIQFIPARITSLLIMLSAIILGGDFWNSARIAVRDRVKDDGINSGWTIAALAGALDVQLEKPGAYTMGDLNEELNLQKIGDALLYIPASLVLFVISTVLVKSVI